MRSPWGKVGGQPPVLIRPSLNSSQMAGHRLVESCDASAVSPRKGGPVREPRYLYAVHDWTRQGTEGFLGHRVCEGPTSGSRARRQCALSLMGDWCGTQEAGTTTRQTGTRLRPQSGGSVPSAPQPKKAVKSCGRERCCLLTGVF